MEIKSKVSLEERTKDQIVQEKEEGEEEMHQYRRASIKRKDVDLLGLTPGCRGCININRKAPGGKSIEHNEECRKRHENKMRKTGDARIVQQDYRLLKSMEQEGERLSKKMKEKDPVVSSTNHKAEFIKKEEQHHPVRFKEENKINLCKFNKINPCKFRQITQCKTRLEQRRKKDKEIKEWVNRLMMRK